MKATVPPEIAPAFDTEAFAREPLLWPLEPMDGPFEVTGTLGEPRGGEGGERFQREWTSMPSRGPWFVPSASGVVTSPLAAGELER